MTAKELKSSPGCIDGNRRAALKMIGAGIVGTVGVSGTTVAQPPTAPPPELPTWGSDGTDHWQLSDTNHPTDSDHTAHRPLYEIKPAGGAHSPHTEGHPGLELPHDLVVDTPGSQEPYTAECHVYLLHDEDGNLTNGPFWGFENPPTISKIDALVADPDEDFTLFDTGVEFTCPVRPHNPTDED